MKQQNDNNIILKITIALVFLIFTSFSQAKPYIQMIDANIPSEYRLARCGNLGPYPNMPLNFNNGIVIKNQLGSGSCPGDQIAVDLDKDKSKITSDDWRGQTLESTYEAVDPKYNHCTCTMRWLLPKGYNCHISSNSDIVECS